MSGEVWFVNPETMSRTIRKDKEGNKFPEGNPLKDHTINYRCRCDWCTSQEKRRLEEKIADREMNREIQNEYGGYWQPWAWDELLEEYYNKYRGTLEELEQEWKNWEQYQLKQAA